MQTLSGMETPSGMECRINCCRQFGDTRFLAVAEELATYCIRGGTRRRTTVALSDCSREADIRPRGLVRSDRAYDVSAVSCAGTAIPALGDDRSAKVCLFQNLIRAPS